MTAPSTIAEQRATTAGHGERAVPARASGIVGQSTQDPAAKPQATPVVGRPLADGLPAVQVAVEPIEKCREFLQTKGLRLTRERSIIVDEVFAHHEHFDAEQLIERLASRRDGKRVSRSTIYRTLSLLEEAGLLRKVARQDDRDVFEHSYGYPHHDHLICGRCGTLIEFHDPRLRAILDEVARERGFRMATHRLEVDGLCDRCSRPPSTRPAKLNLM